MKTIEEIVRKAHDSLLSSATPNPYSDFFKLSDSNIILKRSSSKLVISIDEKFFLKWIASQH